MKKIIFLLTCTCSLYQCSSPPEKQLKKENALTGYWLLDSIHQNDPGRLPYTLSQPLYLDSTETNFLLKEDSIFYTGESQGRNPVFKIELNRVTHLVLRARDSSLYYFHKARRDRSLKIEKIFFAYSYWVGAKETHIEVTGEGAVKIRFKEGNK